MTHPATTNFQRTPLPDRFCNLERLLFAMEQRGLDGIVASTGLNVFYLSGLNAIAHKADEPRPYAVVIPRHAPEDAVLIVADYYVGSLVAQPTWIQDIRAFRAVMLPLDLPPRDDDLERFIPEHGRSLPWMQGLRERYAPGVGAACRQALVDLGIGRGRIAFDDMHFAHQLGLDGLEASDAYDPLMYARAVKTPVELDLLRRSTRLNQGAIEDAIGAWERGMSWREFNRAYHRAVADRGGFVRDPGAMVWGHPRGADAAVTLQTGLEDFEVTPGLHVMFDCHGTLDLYCWDGGKTWVVEGEPEGAGRAHARATAAAAEAVLAAMKPGARVSELQAIGRSAYRKAAVGDAQRAIIFFHGLGLSHMDIEQTRADGTANVDWVLEADMVVALHILYPGGERERIWVEEVARVTPQGGEPFFDWGFEPIAR
jgi:Xaa-Pro aminopeptidase